MVENSLRASIIYMDRSSMQHKSLQIDRRLITASSATRLLSSGLVVVFTDEWGMTRQTFDLGQLGISQELKMLFADSFRMHYAGATTVTRKGCWKALRAFARFVENDGHIQAAQDMGSEAIGRYIAWIDRQNSTNGRPWSNSTRRGRYIYIKMLLFWIFRNRPGLLPATLSFPSVPFRGRHRQSEPQRLPASQLKAILRACYEEIDDIWTCFEKGRTILAQLPEMVPVGKQAEFAGLLRDLHRQGQGILSRCHDGNLPPAREYRFERFGGKRSIAPYLHLTVDTLVPFFLAIGIQTAANPDALRMIGRDCIVPHPLDEYRAIIDWSKPRSGGMVRRAQRRSFDRRRPYAAPNLIDKVRAMTEPLAAYASAEARDRLFLIHGYRSTGISVIKEQTLAAGISRFVIRANQRIVAWNAAHPDQPRVVLSRFSPGQFRGSVATEHYHAAGGDILAAQAVLNHTRVDTTDLYIRGSSTQRLQQETMSRLQRAMITWITAVPVSGTIDKKTDEITPHLLRAETFSHICVNPFAGAASGSVAGRLCPSFGSCLTCPGLVIPVDAQHLARVLQAKHKLEAARNRIDPVRWKKLYAPGYRILSEDILPDFPLSLHADAERIIPSLPPLPDLE